MKVGKTLVVLLLALAAHAAHAASAAGRRPNAAALEAARRVSGRTMLEGKHDIALDAEPVGERDDCGEWQVGTATGYSTDGTDEGDLPMATNDLGEYIVPGIFFREHNVVAVDGGDWGSDKYKYMEVYMEGKLGLLEVWDVCRDQDCAADNANCCSNNKDEFSSPGYLIDIETHALKNIWGFDDAHNWLVAPAWYRVCGKVDAAASVEQYGMECTGLEGDRVCEIPSTHTVEEWEIPSGQEGTYGNDGGDGGEGSGEESNSDESEETEETGETEEVAEEESTDDGAEEEGADDGAEEEGAEEEESE